jgi:hypothetical protein
MKQDLYLYSRIIAHLEYLTTYDEFGSSRSRNVTTIADLADELNEIGLVPTRGYWTKRSLECFLPRVQKRYSAEAIAEVCDCRMVGCSSWEYLSATTSGELVAPRRMLPYHRDPEYTAAPIMRYEPIDGEVWKQYEEQDLFREAAAIKRSARAKKYFERVRINRFASL